jgi:hypothetical protein
MVAASAPRWTGAPKVCPASLEQTATTWPIMSPDGSWPVVQSHAMSTMPVLLAAICGPALTSDAVDGVE